MRPTREPINAVDPGALQSALSTVRPAARTALTSRLNHVLLYLATRSRAELWRVCEECIVLRTSAGGRELEAVTRSCGHPQRF